MQKVRQILGLDCFLLSQDRFNSWNPIDVGRLKVGWHVATQQVIQDIAAWTANGDEHKEFKDDFPLWCLLQGLHNIE